MGDDDVLGRIGELVAEEHRLHELHTGEGLGEDDVRLLRQTEVDLDRCWDLLRQRRARRAAGLDPDDAEVRPESTVERYRQ